MKYNKNAKKALEAIADNAVKNGWIQIADMRGRVLIGKFIGTVCEAVDAFVDMDGSTEYIDENYLAFELFHGPIVAVEYHVDDLKDFMPTPVHSLAKKMFYLKEGFYPINFPCDWMGYEPVFDEPVAGIETLELPF